LNEVDGREKSAWHVVKVVYVVQCFEGMVAGIVWEIVEVCEEEREEDVMKGGVTTIC